MRLSLFHIVLFILVACNNSGETNAVDKSMDSLALKVYIDKEGIITANGSEVSLQRLSVKLDSLEMTDGIVYYSRANIAAEPPPVAIMVMQLIAEHELPVRFYADRKFKRQVKLK